MGIHIPTNTGGGPLSRDLTERQQRIIDFIRDYVRGHGYPPSVREIGQAVDLRSSSTVHGHLSRLEARGFLRRDPDKPRALELLDGASNTVHVRGTRRQAPAAPVRVVPVLGSVKAGLPSLAVQEAESTFPLPSDWVHPSEEAFMLHVDGDSMIGAGILPGDLLAVRRQSHAYNGDIVVALLGEEVTVKRFFRESVRIRLQPENPRMEPIFADEVSILGRVIGLVRRF